MGSFSIYPPCWKHNMKKASHYLNSAFSILFPCLYFIAVYAAASARLSPCVSLHRCFLSIWVNLRFFILISSSPLKLLPERLVQNHTHNSHPYFSSNLPRELEICTLLSNCLFTGLCPSSVCDLQYASLVFQEEVYYRKWHNKKYVFWKSIIFFKWKNILNDFKHEKLSKILTNYNRRFMSFIYLITKHSSYTMENRS